MQSSRRAQPGRGFFLLLFLASGFTGVVFEVISNKLMGLVMGNSVYSITTVVTSFMAGLALGSFLADRICRGRRPLAVYGMLEAGVAAFCLALPVLLELAEPLLKLAYGHLQQHFYMMAAVRFALSFVLLLLPTTLMGATLPVLAAGLAGSGRSVSSTVGLLYAINSLGAVCGALGASFVLLPILGLSTTLKVVALVDLSIAMLAIQGDRRWALAAGEASVDAGAEECEVAEGAPAARPSALAFALVLTGFAAMAYEIAWTRTLVLVLGSSTYAFAMILASFIAGISLGAYVSTWLERVPVAPSALLAGAIALLSIGGLVTLPLLGHLPLVVIDLMTDYSTRWALLQVAELTMVMAVVLVPATLMGACFPLAVRIAATGTGGLARRLGRLYASSTAGNIVGSFCAGALLIPALGIQGTILAASMVEATAAALVLLAFVSASRATRLQLAAAALVLPVLVYTCVPAWDQLLMNSGSYLYAGIYLRSARSLQSDIRTAIRLSGRTVFYREGISATVAVRQLPNGDRGLVVNGKTDASSVADMKTQRLMGHLPALMHPDPKKALVIGLGSGVTLGSVLQHPVKDVDVIEISPEIVEAAHYFVRENRNCMADPRVRLTITDARNHLLLTDDRYDIIAAEPTNPWIAGVASLFTREFFGTLRSHLRPGGVCAQWVPAYSTTTSDFLGVINTFRSVFPYVTLWRSTRGTDYMMIGSESPLIPDRELLAARLKLPGVKSDLVEVGVDDAADLLAHFIATPRTLDPFLVGARVITDDDLSLEFSAPRNLYVRDLPAGGLADTIQEDITRYMKFPGEPERQRASRIVASRIQVALALGYLKTGDFDSACEAIKHAKALAPVHRSSARLVQALYAGLSSLLDRVGRSEEAVVWLKKVADLHPDDPELCNELGNVFSSNGDQVEAEKYYRKALTIDPEHLAAHKNLGVVCYASGRYDEAIHEYEKVVSLSPYEAKMHNNLGILYEKVRQMDRARQEWRTAMKLDPAFDAPRKNLTELEARIAPAAAATTGRS